MCSPTRACATSPGSPCGRPSLSTVLTLVVGIPGAFVLGRYRFRGRAVVRALVTVPFVLPTVVVGRRVQRRSGITGSVGRDPARARLLQLRRRRAHRRRAVVAPRSPARRSRADARRDPVADVRRRHPARAAARDHRGRVDRVPVHLHLVRRDPRPRRPAVRHARDRDLPPDRRSCSTCRSRPRSPSCSSAAVLAALSVGGWARGRRSRCTRPAGRVRGDDTTPDAPGARAFLAANLAVMALLLGVPLGVLVERSFDSRASTSYRAPRPTTSSGVRRPPLGAVWTRCGTPSIATVIALVVGGAAAFALAGAHRSRRRDGGCSTCW